MAFAHRLLEWRFVRRVGVMTGANAVVAGLSVLQGLLIARWLAPENYGVAVLLMGYPAAVLTFFDARAAEAVVRYLGEARIKAEQALAICKLGFTVDAAVAALAVGLVVVSSPWAAEHLAHRPELAALMAVYAAAFLPGAFRGTANGILTTTGAFRRIAWLEVSLGAARFALVIGMALAIPGPEGIVWGNALAVALTGLAYGATGTLAARAAWGGDWWRADGATLAGRRREIARFLLINDLNALVGLIPKQLDVVVLGYFRGPTEVGYYRVANALAALPGMLVSPLQMVAYPAIARLAGTGDRLATLRQARRLALQGGLPVAACSLVAAFGLPYAIPLLAGEPFRPAIPAAQLLLAGTSIWLAFFWLRPTLMALGLVGGMLAFSLAAVVFMLAAFALVVPTWGYVGLAACLLVSQLGTHIGATAWLFGRARRVA